MNSILAKSSDNQLHGILAPKQNEGVETAGSLAMNVFHSLFDNNDSYDEFSTSNPFTVDYSQYSESDTVAYGGFLSDFSNAVSTLSSEGGSFSDGGFSGASAGASCGSSSGGFTSVC